MDLDAVLVTAEAKRLAEELQHEARMERIYPIIQLALNKAREAGYEQGYTEGFYDGRKDR